MASLTDSNDIDLPCGRTRLIAWAALAAAAVVAYAVPYMSICSEALSSVDAVVLLLLLMKLWIIALKARVNIRWG